MNPNRPDRQPFQDIRSAFNLLAHLADGYATGILPFMRKDFGTEFFGFNALVALLVMLLFGAMANANDLLAYMGVWLVIAFAHRLDAARTARKGRLVHTRYVGDPALARKLAPKAKRRTQEMLVEPAICLVVGMLFCPYAPGVGQYLIVGAFAVFMFNGMHRAAQERRVRHMQDAYIENQATARMFRGRDDDF